jgi:hypothetical protein
MAVGIWDRTQVIVNLSRISERAEKTCRPVLEDSFWMTGNPQLEPRGVKRCQIIRLLGHHATIGNGKRAWEKASGVVQNPGAMPT